ncbi:MAG: TetR/AcrR family transcriptional regulator [Cohaesibacteraceae bacterium]|nr:TetR/AcrR family transcriptional regulator [Cohaesibacteraceae bacterium]
MGIIERKARAFAARRKAILDAAVDLATRNGWTRVSMRDIASIIEYSVPVIYEHFDNRDALVGAVADRGYARLSEKISGTARIQNENPAIAIGALGMTIWNFAQEQPVLYNAMFGQDGVTSDAGVSDLAKELIEITTTTTRELALILGWTATEHYRHIMMVLGTVHGIHCLVANGLVEGGPEQGRMLAKLALIQLVTTNKNSH